MVNHNFSPPFGIICLVHFFPFAWVRVAKIQVLLCKNSRGLPFEMEDIQTEKGQHNMLDMLGAPAFES